MSIIIPLNKGDNTKSPKHAQTVPQLRTCLDDAIAASMASVEEQAARDEISFRELEQLVRTLVFGIGRALLVLFLALRDEHLLKVGCAGKRFEVSGRRYRKAPAIGRNLSTLFGVVRYHRTCMREVAANDRHGFHPLDLSLGLGADKFSWNVLSMAVRLATKLSFAEARSTMATFVPQTPSTEVIENAVLGLGRHTEAWVEHAPLAEDDGEVLVIQIDGKGAPMAWRRTES